MSRYTITPWRTPSDLLTVRTQLYGQTATPDTQTLAISRIMSWKVRGNLPHAVESTALLLDALLHHQQSPQNSIFSIRAVYAAAFTRFVTGFCDIGRNRERLLEPSSMLEIARGIGMPEEFVALRHEATHEELPSVQRLVGFCERGLEWLWGVYWSRLVEDVEPEVGEVMDLDVVSEGRRLLKEFRRERKASFKTKGKEGARVQGEVVKKAAAECAGLWRGREGKVEEFVGVLLGERMLFPSDRGLNAPMSGAYLLWDNFLQALSSPSKKQENTFLATLLKRMHAAMNLPTAQETEKEALNHWLLHIATSDAWSRTRQSAGIDVEGQIMTFCCLHPSPWSLKLGNELLEAGDEMFVESWEDLLSASAISGSIDVSLGTGDAVPEVEMGDAVEDDAGTDYQSEVGGDLPAWRQALSAPAVPIGVV